MKAKRRRRKPRESDVAELLDNRAYGHKIATRRQVLLLDVRASVWWVQYAADE